MFWITAVVTLLVVLASLYVTYYLVYAVKPPTIITSNKTMRRFLEKHCPALYQTYWPPIWALQRHVHSISRHAFQSWPSITMNRETVRLSDGGHVCLDWCNEKDSVDDSKSCRPTVVILPGLSGSSEEKYIAHFLHDMTECNYRSLAFNFRGCGNSGLSTTKLFCAGIVDDLDEVICHIKQRFPKSPLIAAGTSLGGIQIMCYLNECYKLQKDPQLIAAFTISVPWNLHIASSRIHQPLNRHTINAHITNDLKDIVKKNREIFMKEKSLPFDYDTAMKCYCLQDIEQQITCLMFGFKDVFSMKELASPHNNVAGIRIPLLALNAEDDMFCPRDAIPENDILNNEHIVLTLTRKGGHGAFMHSVSPFGKNLMDHILIQFTKAMFNHQHELQQSSS